jgi:PAS domain S-box-containing protein
MGDTQTILVLGGAAYGTATIPSHLHIVRVATRAAADALLATGGSAAVVSALDEPSYPWRELLDTARAASAPVLLLGRPDDAAGAVAALRHGAADVVVTAPGYEALLAERLAAVLAQPTAARIRHAEDALHASEARLQFLLAHTPAVIFTVRVDGASQPTFISESVRDMLGYDAAAFLERPDFWFDHLHPEDAARLRSTPSPLWTLGKNTIEYRFLHADGGYRWLQSGSLLVRDDAGAPFELIGYMIDVSARHEAEAALRQANAELSQANAELERAARLKDDFLASMSHELRTPLHAVLGRAETLLEQIHGPLSERQRHAVKSIEESGRNLLDLINDVLDLSRIEAGRMELNLAPMAIEPACRSCIAMITSAAAQKNLGVSLQIAPGLTAVLADERRMKQVVVNLLTNAVKFTPEGGAIGLDAGWDEASGELRFTVWDTGIGIAADEITRLFKPFVQLDSKLSRKYNGTGLGLVLVERIMALHGGRVWVESEPAHGSRFIIALPAERPTTTALIAAPLEYAEPPRAGQVLREPGMSTPLVLLADDNADNLLVMKEYIGRHGYRLVTADNGYDAVAHAAELRPAIILMDVRMPGLDGVEAITRIRADEGMAQVPIIALTGLDTPMDRQRCLAAGANDYLTKPVGLRELIRKIAAHLETRQEKPYQ